MASKGRIVGLPGNTVETKGFAREYRHYLERSDEHLKRDYVSFVGDQRVYHRLLQDEVERRLPGPVELLELGSGSGCTTTLISTWPSARVMAVDILGEALACTRRTLKVCGGRSEKVRCVVADGTRLPCRDASIDVVYHQGLLEHFRDTEPLMGEMRRVLKPGGSLVMNVPQTYSWYTIKKWLALKRGRWAPGWETSFSSGELQDLARRHQLTLAGVKGQTYDSKWNELAKGYRQWIRPWVPKRWDAVWTRSWQEVLDRQGHRFLLEIIGVFHKI